YGHRVTRGTAANGCDGHHRCGGDHQHGEAQPSWAKSLEHISAPSFASHRRAVKPTESSELGYDRDDVCIVIARGHDLLVAELGETRETPGDQDPTVRGIGSDGVDAHREEAGKALGPLGHSRVGSQSGCPGVVEAPGPD